MNSDDQAFWIVVCFAFIFLQIMLYLTTMKDKVTRGTEVFSLVCSLIQVILLFIAIYSWGEFDTPQEAYTYFTRLFRRIRVVPT